MSMLDPQEKKVLPMADMEGRAIHRAALARLSR
jgi:hypothetical protein